MTTDEILAQLNTWGEIHNYTTDNIFESLIYGLGIMDEMATGTIDRNGWGDRFVTTTSQIIRFDLQAKRWYDAGQYEAVAASGSYRTTDGRYAWHHSPCGAGSTATWDNPTEAVSNYAGHDARCANYGFND